jgi:hypothetical protein
MFCTKCGSPNFDEALFCKSCASPFAAIMPMERPAVRSDNAFGKVCKWGIALWSMFCLYGAISGMANVSEQNNGHLGNAAAIGATIGLGIWAFAWFVPMTGTSVLYLLFGRKWAAVPPTRATAEAASATGASGSLESDKWPPTIVRRGAVVVALLVALVAIGQLTKTDQTQSTPSSSTAFEMPAPSSDPSNDSNGIKTASFVLDLKVKNSHWSKSEFGLVTWNLRVHNLSKNTAYKDLHFKTTYWAPSGTQIDESLIGHTEYVVIRPGKTMSIKFDEFAHSQASSASISIDSATQTE